MVVKMGMEVTKLRNSMNRNYSHTAIYLFSELDPLVGQSTAFIIINFAYFNIVCGNIGLFNLCVQYMHAHMFICVHTCACSKNQTHPEVGPIVILQAAYPLSHLPIPNP